MEGEGVELQELAGSVSGSSSTSSLTPDGDSTDSPSREDETIDEEPELQIKVGGEIVPLRDFLREDKKQTAPHYKPIEVVVSHLTQTVKAVPPQIKQTSVATELNLWAKLRQKKEELDLLHDVSFYLKPGEMTLLLGAPGCGKSTLLKLLGCKNVAGKTSGHILFNGEDPRQGNYDRSISLVPQQDIHIAQLTVRETLKFSADCQMASWLKAEDRNRRVDTMLQILGLSHRANTVVGDALLRGVSGGEKKRVTIGVEAIKDMSIFLMDEPTTGLDSQASYDILRAVRILADMKATVLASLLQPSYEVFNLFDNVLILTRGKVSFFGTRQEAMDHFEGLGYRCAQLTNPAEFLRTDSVQLGRATQARLTVLTGTEEVTESGAGFVANPDKFRPDDEDEDDEPFHWLTPDEFVAAYKASPTYERVMEYIEKASASSSSSEGKVFEEELTYKEPKYPTSILRQSWLLTKRAFIKEWRNMATNRYRIIVALFLALVLGTLFLQLDDHQEDARTKLGLIFTIMAYFSFSSLNGLPAIINEREVYYYQRDTRYYTPFPYLLANILAEVPITVIETLIYCCITYWMTGLNTNGDRFIYFLLLCGSYYFMTKSFNRMVASCVPNLNAAQAVSPVLTALSILFGGFIKIRTEIPGWWIWFYWANPATYGFQGLVSNEFWDTTYKCKSDELVPPTGYPLLNVSYPLGYQGSQTCPVTSGTSYAVNEFDAWDYSWLKWVFLAVVICYWFIFNTLALLALWLIRHNPPPAPRMRERETSEDDMPLANIQEIKKSAAEKQKLRRKKHHHLFYDVDISSATQGGSYLSWRNLNYSVYVRKKLKKTELQLLHDVSGYVKPGMMLALMGSSGAGKSTLLDVLARRKTGGKIEGEILINGRKAGSQLNRIVGYVEQQDIHNPSQTVLEALEFSAMCRLPHFIPAWQKRQYAYSLLAILGLEKEADMIIGNNSQDGISADQRKRLTMGVEMAADPAILFLDEPTSGLDSFGAERVMKAVQNITARGTPVICTIHQPSATIFGMFSHLLLLKKGGYTTYFGPIGEKPGDCSLLLDYFDKVLGHKMKPFDNPAEFILEVTGAGITKAKKDDAPTENPDEDKVVEAYRNSDYFMETQEALEKGIYPTQVEKEELTGNNLRKRWKRLKDKMKGRYSTPFHVQLYMLIIRSFLQYWRTPPQFLAKIIAPLGLGTIMGTLFLQMDDNQNGALQRASAIYFTLINCNLIALSLLARVILDRAVFYRENTARTYNSLAYGFMMIIVEYPFCVVAATLYLVPFYFIAGYQYDAAKFWTFWGVLVLNYLVSFALVQALTLLAPNLVLANTFCATAFTMFVIFSGFLIRRDNIPDYWIWMHYLDINMYPLELLVANEMKGLDLHCSANEFVVVPINGTTDSLLFCPFTTGEQFTKSLDFDEDNMLRNGLVFLGFYLVFVSLILIFIKFVRHQKR